MARTQAGRGGRRPAVRTFGRRCRTPGPYAGAYLLPARPLEGFHPGGRAQGRGIYQGVRRQGLRPLRILSAQRPLHRDLGADGRRPADRDPRGEEAGDDCRCPDGTQIAWIQAIHAAPYFAALQFAPAAEVLAMPAPDPRLAYVQGVAITRAPWPMRSRRMRSASTGR